MSCRGRYSEVDKSGHTPVTESLSWEGQVWHADAHARTCRTFDCPLQLAAIYVSVREHSSLYCESESARILISGCALPFLPMLRLYVVPPTMRL